MQATTAGRVWVNSRLPLPLRDPHIRLDSKAVTALFERIAHDRPEDYAATVRHLLDVGRTVGYRSGGYSFGIKSLRRPAASILLENELRPKLDAVQARTDLTDDQKRDETVRLLGDAQSGFEKRVYDEAVGEKNPLAMQVQSGSRGKPSTLQTLIGGDLLYTDARGRGIPVPVFNSYSSGLSPVEYFSGAYGTRKGIADTKMMTAHAGFLAKTLIGTAHRLLVTGLDHDSAKHGPDPNEHRGLPVDTDDRDNVGALLARPLAGYDRNTVLNPKILAHLKSLGHDQILVRSPLTSNSPDGGVYARDAGVRERGGLPTAGDQIGISAAQAIGEVVSQGSLGSKHSGGVGKGVMSGPTGFKLLNLLAQSPETSPFWAAHAADDGVVRGIEKAPAGGWNVQIGSHDHHVPPHAELKVKVGDRVEGGDLLSTGVPNPNEMVKHLGIGEGRRRFLSAFREAMGGTGPAHRRNLELVTRGLVNHVRLTDEVGDWVPDDVVPYDVIERGWQPRPGATKTTPDQAVGRHLEKPVLHYTVGTRIRPSVAAQLQKFGVKDVTSHAEPPPFVPEYVRGLDNLQHDPDWQTRMMGSNLQKTTLKAVHLGHESDEAGTSFVPSLARTVGFGETGPVKAYKPQVLSGPLKTV